MSLFPAYTEDSREEQLQLVVDDDGSYEKKGSHGGWLINSSFQVEVQEQDACSSKAGYATRIHSMADKHKTRKTKKKHKKEKKRSNPSKDKQMSEFYSTTCGEYYIDKNPIGGYLSVETLYKPACPKYHKGNFRPIGLRRKEVEENWKRYYKNEIEKNIHDDDKIIKTELEHFSAKIREFNKKLAQFPTDVPTWIEYANYQEKAPFKLTKTQIAERKIEILEKSMVHNVSNDFVYRCYVSILESSYPSFETSKILEKLLIRDPTNYVLWTAQINATQTSMARCVVPDVLKLYEQCMQKMYRRDKDDEVMLKLFKNCALFLRQAGLSEQLFALIKLALELNVSTDKFTKIQPKDTDQQILIDYEEVILNSGLPMNEIWLRIEKLRQNFNFLPWPRNSPCSDPQKIVFNQDICFFIFPLSHKTNSFVLAILILDLLKIPVFIGTSLKQQFLFKAESTSEFDAVEGILVACLRQGTNLIRSSNFDLHIYELVKVLTSGPSFLNTNVEHEVYLNTVMEILLLCSESFVENERRRVIFIILWLKFCRLLVLIERLSGKLTNDFSANVETKIKEILKQNENRNVLNFYTEFALIEYELGNVAVAENILTNALNETSVKTQSKVDAYYSYVTMAEILLAECHEKSALKVLTCLTLDMPLDNIDNFELTETKKLFANKKLMQWCNESIYVEKNIKTMNIEQYFLPDYFLCLLKATTYYKILLKLNREAISFLQSVIGNFADSNPRSCYIRENVYEFFLSILRQNCNECSNSNELVYNTAMNAVSDFPENVLILKTCATLDGQPWYKVQKLFKKANTPVSLLFFICSARYRLLKVHTFHDSSEFNSFCFNSAYYTRVANILREATSKSSPLRKNSLVWRLYLRCLSDMKKDFECCKNALFSSLDECPWNKALYLDGSIFVPQELTHIQDLIIEKQLRIYALPEELEILRTGFDPYKASSNAE